MFIWVNENTAKGMEEEYKDHVPAMRYTRATERME